jgi:nucleoside-diphosphate-sugar epimerase
MKVFVTGGTGKLGSKVIKLLLKNKHEVVALTRNKLIENCENVEGDLFSFDTSAMKGCDAVIHIAGLVNFYSKDDLFNVNIDGTRVIVEKANECETPYFLHISSISVYGKKDNEDITEETKLKPDTLYAKSKYHSELEITKFKGKKCILRPGMIYGAGYKNGFDKALKMIKKGKFYVFGSGNNHVPLVSVDLIAENIVFCLENEIVGIYNSIDDEKITQNEVLDFVAKTLNINLKIIKIPKNLTKPLILFYNLINKNKIPYEYIQMLNTNRKVNSKLYNMSFKTKLNQKEQLKEFIELLDVE